MRNLWLQRMRSASKMNGIESELRLIVVQEWVYREDAGLLREYSAKLRSKRVKEKKGGGL